MKFISFVSVIAIFYLISFCLALKRKSRKLKTKSKANPSAYKKINDGWLAQCKPCGLNNASDLTFKCPHTTKESDKLFTCSNCIPKKNTTAKCTGCFGVTNTIGGCFTDKLLNEKNTVNIVSKSNYILVDNEQFAIMTKSVSGEVEPEVVEPEVVKPEVVKPEVVKPEVVKPEVVKPEVSVVKEVKPDDIIDKTLVVSSAFLILDATSSMKTKLAKLESEILELNQTTEITYCYQPPDGVATVKALPKGSNTTGFNESVLKEGSVLFSGCLNKFLKDTAHKYDMIYIIGDGAFEENLTSITKYFVGKDPIIRKSTLLHKGKETIDIKWNSIVKLQAGFDHRVVEVI